MSEPIIKIVANKQWWLNKQDLLRGLAVATFSGPIGALVDALTKDGPFEFTWKGFAKGCVVGLLSYLLKNFSTPSNTTVQIQPAAKPLEGTFVAPAEVKINMSPGEKPIVTTSVG